jgi:hypothetical protein
MVGDMNVRAGQCHCGEVRFEVTLSAGFNSIRRCTCSYCRMRGAVVVMAEMGGIKVLQGEDALTSYRIRAALLLLSVRNIHTSPTTIQSESVCHKCSLPGRYKPIRFL